MAYTSFADKLVRVDGQTQLSASTHNAEVDGIQAEFEDRMEASLLNGVLSGLECSISGTNIALSSGEAYCEGKRYSGSASVAFSGADAATYYIYIDPTDDASPYKRSTTAPTTAQLTLGQVVWSGSALSGLVDLREWGTVPWCRGGWVSGSVTTGCIGFWIVPFDIWVEDIQIAAQSLPVATSVIVDLRAGAAGSTPTTVFTTTSYRPTLATTATTWYPVANTGYVQVKRKLTTGEILAVYVDQTDTSSMAADLTFEIRGRVYGKSS